MLFNQKNIIWFIEKLIECKEIQCRDFFIRDEDRWARIFVGVHHIGIVIYDTPFTDEFFSPIANIFEYSLFLPEKVVPIPGDYRVKRWSDILELSLRIQVFLDECLEDGWKGNCCTPDTELVIIWDRVTPNIILKRDFISLVEYENKKED